MSTLKTFDVSYCEQMDVQSQIFRCQAESPDHAREQTLNAHPGADIQFIEHRADVLADGEYFADDGCWLTVRNASVRINPRDDGLSISLYPIGEEDGDCVAETFATWIELGLAED